MATVSGVRDLLFSTYPQFSTADAAKLTQIDNLIEMAISEACALKGKVSDTRYNMGLVWLSAYYISDSGIGSNASGSVIEEKNGDQTIKYQSKSGNNSKEKHQENKYGQWYDNLLKSVFRKPLIV